MFIGQLSKGQENKIHSLPEKEGGDIFYSLESSLRSEFLLTLSLNSSVAGTDQKYG